MNKQPREGSSVGRKVIVDELDQITNPYNDNDKKFLFENTKVFLTYGSKKCPVHLDKEDFILWAHRLFPDTPILFIRLAHESGAVNQDTGEKFDHTHVLIKWDEAVRTKSCRKFDFCADIDGRDITLHPNIRRIKTQTHFDRCCRYIAKEDEENVDLLNIFTTWQESLKCCKTKADVIEIACKPSDLNGLLVAFDIVSNEKKWAKVDYEKTLSRWQYMLYQRLNQTSFGIPYSIAFKNVDQIDDWNSDESFEEIGDQRIGRKVITIYNTKGNAGKTWFLKTLMTKEPWRFLALQGIARARDISSQIEQALGNGWNGDTILINITRQAADHKIYNSIELCCDGLITTEKYIGKTSSWNCKNVVIFTNFMPNIHAMSIDRWEVYRVRKVNSDLRAIPIDVCIETYKEEASLRRDIE